MSGLSAELPYLRSLQRLRREVDDLFRSGALAFETIVDSTNVDTTNWYRSGDLVEKALLGRMRRQLDSKNFTTSEQLLREIEDDALSKLYEGGAHGKIPFFSAARVMQSLVDSGRFAFSTPCLVCYYVVVREIYSTDFPDWSTGGARAGEGDESSAFVTGECVRAIYAFARTLLRTADFFEAIPALQREANLILWINSTDDALESWCKTESDRLVETARRHFLASENSLTFELKSIPEILNLHDLSHFLNELSETLPEAFRRCCEQFEKAQEQALAFRSQESGRKKDRSESAHLVAMGALDAAIARSQEALKIAADGPVPKRYAELGWLFRRIAADVRKIAAPAAQFVTSILDRELAAASALPALTWDARELLFAAVCYGYSTGWRHDERLDRAATLLMGTVTEHGLLPAWRPFHATRGGFVIHAIGFEVARSMAQLLRHVRVELQPKMIERLLKIFDDNKVVIEERRKSRTSEGTEKAELELAQDDNERYKLIAYGWCSESCPIPRKATIWVTALAMMALSRLKRLLDHRINDKIFQYLNVTQIDQQRDLMKLHQLLFSDYGMRGLKDPILDELRLTTPISLYLERMRSHVEQRYSSRASDSPSHSLILYGPPGTGKSTLIQALAASARRPLVIITPGDIAISGEDGLEQNAAEIFEALSLLTRAVVLFDEFEPVLRTRRRQGQSTDRNVFEFLLPGMLPRLTFFYERAKERGVSYCLVTNHFEELDDAAVRDGRFDYRVPIFHPDLLSRAGALMRALGNEFGKAFEQKGEDRTKDWGPDWRIRFAEAIGESSGVSAGVFAKHWLRKGTEANPSILQFVKSPDRTGDEIPEIRDARRQHKEASAQTVTAQSVDPQPVGTKGDSRVDPEPRAVVLANQLQELLRRWDAVALQQSADLSKVLSNGPTEHGC